MCTQMFGEPQSAAGAPRGGTRQMGPSPAWIQMWGGPKGTVSVPKAPQIQMLEELQSTIRAPQLQMWGHKWVLFTP